MALYGRTVATIIKRANSNKCRKTEEHEERLSNEMSGGAFIGICDLWGFQDSKPSRLEQLCINLSSETLQHFYHTYTFKTAQSGNFYRSPCEEVIQLVSSQVCHWQHRDSVGMLLVHWDISPPGHADQSCC